MNISEVTVPMTPLLLTGILRLVLARCAGLGPQAVFVKRGEGIHTLICRGESPDQAEQRAVAAAREVMAIAPILRNRLGLSRLECTRIAIAGTDVLVTVAWS